MKAYADVHAHNYLSNCCQDNQATAESYVNQAAACGVKILGFANHIWDERVEGANSWYQRQSLAFSMQIKNQIPADTKGVKVLVGAETEYCGMSDTLGMSVEGVKELDFILIPHTHVHMRNFVMPSTEDVNRARSTLASKIETLGLSQERAKVLAKNVPEAELEPFMGEKTVDYIQYVADFMAKSFESLMNNPTLIEISKQIPVSVAHPFQAVGDNSKNPEMLRRIPDETFIRLFKLAAERGVGLEINTNCNYPEMLHVLKLAKEQGCRFTTGTDTHSIENIKCIDEINPTLEALGITEADLMDFLRL